MKKNVLLNLQSNPGYLSLTPNFQVLIVDLADRVDLWPRTNYINFISSFPSKKPMRIFFSYAALDRDFAKDIASQLSEEGYDVSYPDQDLSAGDNWSLKIGEALRDSKAMVVLLTPESVESEWVRREIEYALGSKNYKGRLITVLVRPTENIPWILRKFPMIRAGRNSVETSKRIAEALRHAE
jgi:hypothetical protein